MIAALYLAVTLGIGLVAVYGSGVLRTPDPPAADTAGPRAKKPATASPVASAPPRPGPRPKAGDGDARSHNPARGSGRTPYLEKGPGTFTWATPASGRAGQGGKLIRYGVKLEDGTGLDSAAVAAEIDRVLRDDRGWTRRAVASFQHVAEPPYDMVVQIASPKTADALCGAWGLDTGGELNCANAPDLIVNVRRWVELSDQYKGRPHDYRALIINHEAGHVLGYGHRGCPGPGKPAPAMMQQIKGLKGCVANPWVHDKAGTFIDGPRVP
ncbi:MULTISPECIES: DUF3152 domain-containing protein [unclassified Streptomyces]|uniref:DUF3152 domain-containing protein n=1 Tax=unclassified Streptomyces TaxID=2593676 RepID=UPI00344C149B